MVKSGIRTVEILLVERNRGDLELFIKLFEESSIPNTFRFAGSGDQAIKMMLQMDAYSNMTPPDVVIFDIHTFDKKEWVGLQAIAKEAGAKCIPVVMLTKDKKIKEDAGKSLSCPIVSLDKPDALDQYKKIVEEVEEFWLSKHSFKYF
jgi:two-component system response regulator